MKKTILFLAAGALALAANARILRVNNASGSSAPYQTIGAALEAAAEGDTIMLDASTQTYGSVDLNKRVVVLGPGYWLTENGITEEGPGYAMLGSGVQNPTITAEGVVVKGLAFYRGITIKAPKAVVNKCRFTGGIVLEGADNCIIHQNIVAGDIRGDQYNKASYCQVTNNILTDGVNGFVDSYIAYNTMHIDNSVNFNLYTCRGCTVEHNWSTTELKANETAAAENNFSANHVSEDYKELLHSLNYGTDGIIDRDVANLEVDAQLRDAYGAFAGATPYVLSGVPAGPVIQDLVVPASVERGSKLQVTVKVGIQQ